MQLSETEVTRKFVLAPDKINTGTDVEQLIDEARKQYRRDVGETTLDKTHWLAMSIEHNVLTFHYSFTPNPESSS